MTKVGTKRNIDEKKQRFLEALEKSMGIVTAACKASDVPRATLYRWFSADKEFKARVDEIIEIQTDFVESELLKRIKEGDTTAIIFYLKTKGKKRGYGEFEKTKDTVIKVNVVEE